MNRLRVQLILAFMVVVLFAVSAIAVLIVQTTNTQFRQYITNSSMTASGSGLEQLIAYHQEQGSWDGVEGLLQQSVFVGDPRSMPAPDTTHRFERSGTLEVTLADAAARIIYDSAGGTEGKRLESAEIAQALPITEGDDGEVIGYLLLSLPTGPDRLGELEQRFLDRMQEILITGAALAVGLALILGIVISRNLTAPLQRLASAARSVASGDLDQQLRVEGSAEMAEVAQAFNDMTAALGDSERQRQHMVADVAHELRTPLTVLQGNLRAMLDGVYPTDQAEISRLYDETRLLGRLVDDLRELALADAGQLRLHLHRTDVHQIVESTVESLAPAAECEGVSLVSAVADNVPYVEADSDRVAQVLRNLLINALRHTPSGGSIQVTAALSSDAVELAVSDTGEGIGPEALPHVFERFWRVDPARTRTGGTGLGLAIAQSLVEAQRGRIWAESTPGEGSTFRFTLPIAPG
ncbi:MAG: HAMP domain-containing histidine kinase [Anaerolineae bacterium]|nr:HAMP domain-containing histidine kinase [Anaerolineae bacterium]